MDVPNDRHEFIGPPCRWIQKRKQENNTVIRQVLNLISSLNKLLCSSKLFYIIACEI